MDQNILQVVKDGAIAILKGHDPETDVYAEEIMRTDGTLEAGDEEWDSRKWYFVEVIPTSFTTMGPDQTEVSLTVSVDYHEPEESIRQYGQKAIDLDRVFRPVFRFSYGGERRSITVSRLSTNISGGMLHLTFPLTFLVSDDPEDLPVMEGLEIKTERG